MIKEVTTPHLCQFPIMNRGTKCFLTNKNIRGEKNLRSLNFKKSAFPTSMQQDKSKLKYNSEGQIDLKPKKFKKIHCCQQVS